MRYDQEARSVKSAPFLLLFALIWLYRCWHLLHIDYDLYVDEAYYYNWAKHLAWGYYSKPPMLAWLIRLSTELFGDTPFGIRAGALFVYPVTTWVVYLIARELYDRRVALWSALAFFTLPSVWISSIIISTDVVLLLFWALGLFFFLRAVRYGRTGDWIAAGVAGGLGLLSKYNFLFFLIAALLYLAAVPERRRYFKAPGLYLAMGIALLLFLPNLWWNYHHDFISFVHTREISQVDRALFHPGKFLEFFGAQFLVFGPLFFGLYLYLITRKRSYHQERSLLLTLFSIVPLGAIMLLALLSHALANWAAPAYVSATILVTAFLLRGGYRRWIAGSILLHTFLGVVLYAYHPIAHALHIELTRKNDPYKRMMGWQKVAQEIGAFKRRYPDTTLLVDARAEAAELDYYLHTKCYLYNPSHKVHNQYHITRPLKELKGRDLLYVTTHPIAREMREEFEVIVPLGRVNVRVYRDFNRTYELYYLKKFKGYRNGS